MKKTIAFMLTFFLCFLLTACDPGTYSFDCNELTNSVIGVELIDYENTKQEKFISWVPDHSSALLPFDESEMTVLETLDEDRLPDFLEQLSEADILADYYVYNSPKDICLKLNCTNGDFLIISCNNESFAGYIGKYSGSGEVIEFIGCLSNYQYFKSLVNDFFSFKI